MRISQLFPHPPIRVARRIHVRVRVAEYRGRKSDLTIALSWCRIEAERETMSQHDKKAVDLLKPVIELTDGFNYMIFRTFVGTMVKQAEEGDKAAKEIVTVVARFSRLVSIGLKEFANVTQS